PGKLVLTIHVNEGRQYRIGSINITGNEVVPKRALYLALTQTPGDVFAPSKLDEDIQKLQDFYGQGGHLDARVNLLRIPNLETGDIGLQYQIEEGDPYKVESVRIEGNTQTKSIVLLRELVLGPGETFDTVRMEISKLRLENTRYFEDVNMTDET